MFKYIARHLLVTISAFFRITVLVYLVSTMAPESPLEMLITDPMATKEGMKILKTRMGLNDSAIIQYSRWFGTILQGNLGISYRNSLPILGQVPEKLEPALILTLSSTALSVLIAIPLGIISAHKPYSAWDYTSSGFAFVGASTLTFFTGLVMIYLFTIKPRVLPMGGTYDAGVHTVGSAVNHLVLLCLVLATFNISSILEQTRGNIMKVFGENCIRAVRAKGLVEPRAAIVHGLGNALVLVVIVLGTVIPLMSGGAMVAEQVFSWPGLGNPMVQSISVRDYPMIMGITAVIVTAVLVDNILMDITYNLLDSEIRENRQPPYRFVDNLTRWTACIVHKRSEDSCNRGGRKVSEIIIAKKDSYYRDVLKKFMACELAMIDVAITALKIFLVVLLPIILRLGPHTSDILAFSAKSGPGHLLRTDDTGRDVFARLMYGGRVPLLVGLLSAIIGLCIDVPLGLTAGYYKGIWEIIVMRVVDIFMSFPSVILALVLVAVIGPSVQTVTLVISVLEWTDSAKLIYGNVLSVRRKEYVESTRTVRTKDLPLLMKYAVPNALVPILVGLTSCTAQVIIQESAFNFLGMGVQSPQVSWGNILYATQFITMLSSRPWFWVPPGILLVLTATSTNFVGDGIKDTLNSKTKIKKK